MPQIMKWGDGERQKLVAGAEPKFFLPSSKNKNEQSPPLHFSEIHPQIWTYTRFNSIIPFTHGKKVVVTKKNKRLLLMTLKNTIPLSTSNSSTLLTSLVVLLSITLSSSSLQHHYHHHLILLVILLRLQLLVNWPCLSRSAVKIHARGGGAPSRTNNQKDLLFVRRRKLF